MFGFGQKKYSKGFSLLEMGISFAIAGVIVAAVVGGQKIVEKSKTQGAISSIHKLIELTHKFEDKYHSLPGDASLFGDTTFFETNQGNAYVAGFVANTNGDNNRRVTGNERYYFWYHLKKGLDFPINFSIDSDGIIPSSDLSEITIASEAAAGVVPRGPKENSYIMAETIGDKSIGGTIDELGLVFSMYRKGSTEDGVLSVEEISRLDEDLDDGRPLTGAIQTIPADDGGDTTACATFHVDNPSAGYNFAAKGNIGDNCVLRVLANPKQRLIEARNTGGDVVKCNTSTIGGMRTATETCPSGFAGRVVEICDHTGTWQTSYKYCRQSECSGGKFPGNTLDLDCDPPYSGEITMTCNVQGKWDITDGCTEPDLEDKACTENRVIACPIGQTGNKTWTCTSNEYDAVTNNCSTILCGADAIHTEQDSATSCPTGYLSTTKVKEICTIKGGGTWMIHRNECSLDPLSGCTPDDTKSMSCPYGTSGSNFNVRCNSLGAWEEIVAVQENCKSVRCGSYDIGSYRSSSVTCPSGSGTVLEVCTITATDTANWQIDTSNCVANTAATCGAALAPEYNDNWVVTEQGKTRVNSCAEGYSTANNTVPKRKCNNGAIWSDIINQCTADNLDIESLGTALVWLDATDLTASNDHNDNVTSWDNKVAAAPDFSQGTLSNQPKLNNVGTKPVVRFDGNDSVVSGSSIGSAVTVFIVLESTQPGKEIVGYASNSLLQHGPSTSMWEKDNISTNLSMNPTGLHIITMQGTNYYFDNSTAETMDTTVSFSGILNLGMGELNGNIAEVIIYSDAISAANINTIQTYLMRKWGVTN